MYWCFRDSRPQLQVSIWPLSFGHEVVRRCESDNNNNNGDKNNVTQGQIALSDTKGNPFLFFSKLGRCRDYCGFHLSEEESRLEQGSDLPRVREQSWESLGWVSPRPMFLNTAHCCHPEVIEFFLKLTEKQNSECSCTHHSSSKQSSTHGQPCFITTLPTHFHSPETSIFKAKP